MTRILCGALLLAGCSQDLALPSLPTTFAEDSSEAAGLLDFANDPEVDASLLINAIGLDGIPARSLIAHRDGPDAIWGTADDNLFDSLTELETCPEVERSEVLALFEFAWMHGWMETLTRGYDGVGFMPEQARHALEMANKATDADLDRDLDRRAVDSILAARPIDDMTELAELHYVGTGTLLALRDAHWVDATWE